MACAYQGYPVGYIITWQNPDVRLKDGAGENRLIGNITLQSETFGEIIGYENHSGLTLLHDNATPLGRVIRDAGNDSDGKYEGVRYNNVIATYLHGPLLPKNPQIADFLIDTALKRRGIIFSPA